MAEVVLMPKLSDTMTEGVVAEWHKKVGDEVSSGELLAEIETDKATMEFESFYDGILLHIGIEKGQTAPVNDVLAIIGEKGEDVDAILAEANKGKNEASEEESKSEEAAVKDTEPEQEEVKEEKPAASKTEESKPAATSTSSSSQSGDGGRIFASPLAKKLAEEKGIDIGLVKGTGDNGRIVKRDIENYVPYERPEGGAPIRRAAVGEESYSEENVSQMRKTIAKRLAESKFTAPHFYLTMSIDMDNAIAARKAINSEEGVKVSFNDMVIKSVAMALRQHPTVNSAWLGDKIRRNDHVHIGVAVAVEDGLLVPVVRFADSKGLVEINAEVKDYAQKAKDKKLQPQDWEGNTFTISNLGMYGIEEFTAIINPPDSCIMAIGGIQQVPVVKNGEIVPGNVMKVTLSCDHRVVDGASGSEFLNTVKAYLENPVKMLM
jgi:pyruvate dehydrogenase E2 component (dihydrolipoamide acetyltransferase)